MSPTTTSIAAGIVVTFLGLVPLSAVLRDDAATEPAAATSTTVAAPERSTEPAVTEIATPPPEIEGLTESVVRVLMAKGFAASESDASVPASVARALAESGIALTVAEGG